MINFTNYYKYEAIIKIIGNLEILIKGFTSKKEFIEKYFDKLNKLEPTDKLKELYDLCDAIEYDNSIVIYQKSAKKGYMNAVIGLAKSNKKYNIEPDMSLDEKLNIVFDSIDEFDINYVKQIEKNFEG